MSQSADGEGSQPAILLVKSGFYEGLEVPLPGPPTIVGRGRGADIVLAEATISREHLVIGCDATGWYAEDLKSTNGSYANGSRFERHQLKQGDEIVMGRLVVEVTLPESCGASQ